MMMSDQYYYLDRDGTTVVGPFDADVLRAMSVGGAIARSAFVCAAGSEKWYPLSAHPDLSEVPPDLNEQPPAIPASGGAPAEPRLVSVGGWALLVIGALIAVGIGVAQAPSSSRAGNGVAMATSTPSATPTPELSGNAEHGAILAQQILDRNPKLNYAVLSGKTFPRPSGIDLTGAGTYSPYIAFLLPRKDWDAMTEDDRRDLAAYTRNKVIYVREHPDAFMIIPDWAPDYRKEVDRIRHLNKEAWCVGSTMSYSDDRDGNLYLDKPLIKGAACNRE